MSSWISQAAHELKSQQLEMVTPEVTIDTRESKVSTSTSAGSANNVDDAAPSAKAHSTSEYLEGLTLGIIEGVNSRKFEAHPSYENFSPHWKAQSNDASISYPLDQHFQITRQLTIDNPDLWIHVVNTNVVMGYRDLSADVYVDMEHHGFPPGLVRTCIGVFHWKLIDDDDGAKRWLCMRHTGARGMTCTEQRD